MNKENNRSAAGLRRSAIAERIRLREEWSELKGTSGQPLTATNSQKQTLMKKHLVKYRNAKQNPECSQPSKVINMRSCHKSDVSEVLMGVVALVEVGSEPRALPLRAALSALGATVVPAWTPIVTHVVWSQENSLFNISCPVQHLFSQQKVGCTSF
ncbi:hypothetical protein evm_002713 [Chilo suppressalis]|nr:hypothetical protein evm_002713 [Chilo suppressalis]